MNSLLTYIPELFPELDETEEEARGRRSRVSRPSRRGGTSYRGKPKGIVTRPPVGPSGFYAKPRLRPMPLPHLIPVVPPLWRSPWDPGRYDDTDRAQAGSQGSGEPSSSQSGEPPSEYVRWVQDSLNRLLGLQLSIDGVMNRETRSAVRSFQERQGLPVNGLVSPETEAALKTASSAAPGLSQNIAIKPEAEWETANSASCNCSSCKEKTTMNYEPRFEAEPLGGSAAFSEFEGFDTEVLDEWQSETPQESPQRVRWIQESLNKILGLQLKVDGIMGPQTRSATRSFQQRLGLPVNGIVDPATEAAIGTKLGRKPTRLVPPRDSPVAPSREIPAYTQCDFIHPNIDVAAQYALYGMLKSDPANRNASIQMLAAVKTGRLGGIFQEDQRVPGMRGIHLGYGGYGPLIGKYRKSASSAACIPPALNPSDKLPIISFKKALVKNTSVLGEQLRQAYLDCRLPYLHPIPASGKSCTRPPISPSLTTPPPDDPPPRVCRYPRCDLSVPYACGVSNDCFPVPGEKCGVCEGASDNAGKCFDENERRLRAERQKCSDEYKQAFAKYLLECGVEAAKCGFSGDPKACLKAAGCALDPEPLNKHQQCLNQTSKRYIEEGQRCKRLP